MNGIIALKKARQYTDETADSLGSLKGAPCTIKSIVENDDNSVITFEWTGTSGTTENSTLTVKNGTDGINGVDGVSPTITLNRNTSDNGVIITVTNADGTTSTVEVKDGVNGDGSNVDLDGYAKTEDVNNALDLKADKTELFSGSYNDLTDKPTIPSTDGLATTEYVDNAVSNVTVDTSNLVTDEELTTTLADYAKSADITEYDDTEVKESIANLTDTKADKAELDAYVTDTELTDKGYATETFVTNKIAEAQLDGSEIDLTGLATKDELALKADKTEIPDLSGYALKTEIPSTDGLVTEENLSTTLADYVADEELSTALADYTTTSEADEKYVLDEEIEIIDLATLESMLGLSTEELEGLASLLSDQTIELSKTWSSSKIYSELNSTLDSAKQYTLDELSKAIGASYKVVTSVDQMTDSKVLYLLKDADSGMYNIYVYDADTSTAELIGSFEINLDDYLKISDAEAQYVKQTDLVANYATKQEVVDGYATKTELQDAIDDVEVEISETENNQIQTLDDGLFVGSETITISKADYDALSIEEKSNGKTYFVPDDETTEDGTDLTQFAKVSDLEELNSKIEEINKDLGNLTIQSNIVNKTGNYGYIKDCIASVVYNGNTAFLHFNGEIEGTIDLLFSDFGLPNTLKTPVSIYGDESLGQYKTVATTLSETGKYLYVRAFSNSTSVQLHAETADFYAVTFAVKFV